MTCVCGHDEPLHEDSYCIAYEIGRGTCGCCEFRAAGASIIPLRPRRGSYIAPELFVGAIVVAALALYAWTAWAGERLTIDTNACTGDDAADPKAIVSCQQLQWGHVSTAALDSVNERTLTCEPHTVCTVKLGPGNWRIYTPHGQRETTREIDNEAGYEITTDAPVSSP